MADGFLTRSIQWVRNYIDDPATDAKYSDSQITTLLERAWAKVVQEIMRVSTNKPLLYVDIDVTSSNKKYALPPIVGRVVSLEQRDSTGGTVFEYPTPSKPHMPTWPGVQITANMLHFYDTSNYPLGACTYRVWFVPEGCVKLHEGTADETGTTTDSEDYLDVAGSPTYGTVDMRPSAYEGMMLRVLDDANGYVQQRPIHDYDITNDTPRIVVQPNFQFTPSGTVTYEIAPLLCEQLDMVMPLWAARHLAAVNGMTVRYKYLNSEYRSQLRDVRMNESHVDGIVGVSTSWPEHVGRKVKARFGRR